MGKIVFSCHAGGGLVPAEALLYLEELGVKVRPNWYVHEDKETKMRTATIHVGDGQRKWAAGLLAGYGFIVLEPTDIAPIKVSKRWGAPRRHWGPNATAIRVIAGATGVKANLPSVGTYAQKQRKAKAPKRKEAGGLFKTIWDKLNEDL